MALRMNPLSVAKGQRFDCELCGKAAKLGCQHCRVTYYCSEEHQACDWHGIHEKVCQLLGALRTLKPTLGSEDERRRRNITVKMSQHALIDLCRNEASKHLVKGHYELAVPGAMQSLRFSMEVHGTGSIELVPAYLLLAEANLGLKRYKEAEEHLLFANWSVIKVPGCGNELKAQLARAFGKLYASQKRYDEALRQLATDAYHTSLQNGPEHVDTASSLYYLGDVNLLRKNPEVALAFFDKVVEIWFKFLVKLRGRPGEQVSDYLGEAQVGEAAEMLRNILSTRAKHLGVSHIATGEAAYTLGILNHVTGYDHAARELYQQAHDVYVIHFGEDHELTLGVESSLDELDGVPPEERATAKAARAAAAAAGGGGDDGQAERAAEDGGKAGAEAPAGGGEQAAAAAAEAGSGEPPASIAVPTA